MFGSLESGVILQPHTGIELFQTHPHEKDALEHEKICILVCNRDAVNY